MKYKFNILIIDDVADDAELCVIQLKQYGIDFSWRYVECEEEINKALREETFDVVISDYSMVGFDGIAALKIVKEFDVDMPFIMVSGTIGEEVAVNAMKKGAQDYIMKSNMVRLAPAVLREIDDAKTRREYKESQLALLENEAFTNSILIGFPVGIAVFKDRVCQYVNMRLAEMLGYDREELVGKSSRMVYLSVEEYDRVLA
ncbi:MAG: response regulator, partial [Bacteroidota bacterium]|nr:response regulator [Bacteroidota bacterium]